MARKKKQEVVIEPPVTIEEFQAFVETWNKLKPILDLLAPATSAKWVEKYSNKEYSYRWAVGYHDISDEGVYFYYLDTAEYDDYQTAFTNLIPLNTILDPKPFIDAHEAEKANIRKEHTDRQEEWDRQAYENLKARFEGKDVNKD